MLYPYRRNTNHSFTEHLLHKFERLLGDSVIHFTENVQGCNADRSIGTALLPHNSVQIYWILKPWISAVLKGCLTKIWKWLFRTMFMISWKARYLMNAWRTPIRTEILQRGFAKYASAVRSLSSSVVRRVRKGGKSDCQLRHVCMSVRPHGTRQFSLNTS
jgi:hypothetical protein